MMEPKIVKKGELKIVDCVSFGMTMKINLFLLLIMCTSLVFSENVENQHKQTTMGTQHSVENESFKGIMQGNGPFLLSLLLSHGSGLYLMKQPNNAFPYLLSNIIVVDLPILILISGIILNYTSPEFFQGTTLTITEYVVNTCFVIILIAVPLIRFLECREVLKIRKKWSEKK